VTGSAWSAIGRSIVVRRLTQMELQRLRQLRAWAMAGDGVAARAGRLLVRRLEDGALRVPQGRAEGLLFDMRYLPISHAHAGSVASGGLESSVQEALVRHLGRGGALYDIGANVGFFSLLGARLVGLDQGHVYAFEPAPDNAEAIRRNAQLNGVGNVSVIAKAVSAQTGAGRLQIVDDQSWSKLVETGEHPHRQEEIEVETVAIDDLLERDQLLPPTVVKIDVEGAELSVLAGMHRTIEEHHPTIICELHDTHPQFVEAMREHRYRLINLEGTSPIEAADSAYALALPPLHPGD
jgi:FkbM family methyltransferase